MSNKIKLDFFNFDIAVENFSEVHDDNYLVGITKHRVLLLVIQKC